MLSDSQGECLAFETPRVICNSFVTKESLQWVIINLYFLGVDEFIPSELSGNPCNKKHLNNVSTPLQNYIGHYS